MNLKELDKIAKQELEMPSSLNIYEQAYYIASRGLYQQYAKGEITLAQARAEKEQVIKAYEEGQSEMEYFMQLHQVWDKLKQLKEEGFDTVLEMEILEVLDRIL
ncbi:MAG: hypothetical protein H9893_04730 [Candidatus Niameybacter stercoravium]|nr:hypothetical protein [Candidatus Niameybacter stercoravium]